MKLVWSSPFGGEGDGGRGGLYMRGSERYSKYSMPQSCKQDVPKKRAFWSEFQTRPSIVAPLMQKQLPGRDERAFIVAKPANGAGAFTCSAGAPGAYCEAQAQAHFRSSSV